MIYCKYCNEGQAHLCPDREAGDSRCYTRRQEVYEMIPIITPSSTQTGQSTQPAPQPVITTSQQQTNPQEQRSNVAPYACLASIITLLVAGGIILWVSNNNKK